VSHCAQPFKQFLLGFIMLFSYIYIIYFNHMHPYNPLLFPSPFGNPLPNSPPLKIISYYYYQFRSRYERKYAIFVFLSLDHLIQHNDLQFHPFFCKEHNFIFLYGCVYLHITFSLSIHWLLDTRLSTQLGYCE
jgi:hypothetical protein